MNETKGGVVAERVERADTICKRFVGLMGRKAIEPGHALLLDPCGSIHMFFMRFAIDVIFLDAQGQVLRVVRGLAPWRIAAASGSRKVVEMAAGTLTEEIAQGDRLKFE